MLSLFIYRVTRDLIIDINGTVVIAAENAQQADEMFLNLTEEHFYGKYVGKELPRQNNNLNRPFFDEHQKCIIVTPDDDRLAVEGSIRDECWIRIQHPDMISSTNPHVIAAAYQME